MSDLRAIYTLWLRDVIRFLRHKPRVIGSFAMPLIFLFFLGNGISATFGARMGELAGKIGYMEFIYSGILAMNVLFTSIYASMNIVWDREFGFLKEVLVAPVTRRAVVVGRMIGGSTVSVIQGSALLLIAPLVGVDMSFTKAISVFLELWLLAFALTSLGISIAARVQSLEYFQFILNFFTMPMFFLSGALYDLGRFPDWMRLVAGINPFSYGVDMLRGTLSGISVHPMALNIGLLGLFTVITFSLAVYLFERHN